MPGKFAYELFQSLEKPGPKKERTQRTHSTYTLTMKRAYNLI